MVQEAATVSARPVEAAPDVASTAAATVTAVAAATQVESRSCVQHSELISSRRN